ncbi:phage tail protein [Halosimplex amylolyticum]|uniref:phage tail protein n=1 Tax=Halosimplex amylolyticum TaxID=3396616 RepID=UPI003F56F09C
MSARTRENPYLDYRFLVEIDSVVAGGFSEVTGLERSVETQEYDEGGVNGHTHQLWSGESASNVTLRRGLTDAATLWEWVQRSAARPVERKTVLLFVLNRAGEPAWGWSFSDAHPVTWSGPDLSAESGSVAVEEIELTHTGVSRIEGL